MSYRVAIGDEHTVAAQVFVDAKTAEVALDLDQIYSGLYREIYDGWPFRSSLFWHEGQATITTGVADADNLIEFTGHTYSFALRFLLETSRGEPSAG